MTSIRLTPAERQDLLGQYHRSVETDVRLRAHILLLLDAGHPWTTISAVLFCSVSTISRWRQRFEKECVGPIVGRPRGRRSGRHAWATLVVQWVLTLSQADFRFARSRWSCEAATVVLWEDYRVRVALTSRFGHRCMLERLENEHYFRDWREVSSTDTFFRGFKPSLAAERAPALAQPLARAQIRGKVPGNARPKRSRPVLPTPANQA